MGGQGSGFARPGASVPPTAPPPRSGWQRFKEGWQGTGREGERFSDPMPPPPAQQPSGYQQRGPSVWSGVKIGCGMFIVLPLLLLLAFFLLVVILAGSSGG